MDNALHDTDRKATEIGLGRYPELSLQMPAKSILKPAFSSLRAKTPLLPSAEKSQEKIKRDALTKFSDIAENYIAR